MLIDEFYIAPLTDPADIDFAAKGWRYGKSRYGENLIPTLRYLVKIGCPAFGAYTKDGNKLVSWVMTDIDFAGMNGHTIDEYRGKGTHTWIMLYLLCHAGAVKKYGYIPVSNKTSLRNAEFIDAEVFSKKVCHFSISTKSASKL